MPIISDDTFVRPRDLNDRRDPAVLFARSYLAIRTTVGLIGIALPIVFVVGETFFLDGKAHVRGSLSAYYHTSMRDFFIGALCVVGVLLITYMAGQSRRTDFWLSLVAGVAVLGVVFLPTERPDLTRTAPRCGSLPEPPGCSPVQQRWGEDLVATIHFTCALVFILSLAGICFYFAHRERKYDGSPGMARVQTVCGSVIIGAVVWAAIAGPLGWDIYELTPLYLGEVVSIWTFGVSWLLKGRDIWRALNVLPAQRGGKVAASGH